MITNELVIQLVWNKAQLMPGMDPTYWRRDTCGARIYRYAHGDRSNLYGWEVDHVFPVSKGGTDALVNLQALHWRNNAAKGDGLLRCVVSY